VVGDCLTDEYFNVANGDSLQQTTGGLLVWRKADNWTAFTDGYRTWINGSLGLESRLNTQRFLWESGDPSAWIPESDAERQACAALPGNATGPLAADCWAIGQRQRLIATVLQYASQAPAPAIQPPVLPTATPIPPAPIVVPILPSLPAHTNGAEWVSVDKVVSDYGDQVLVTRANGETWLLEYGVDCLSLSMDEGG
jgi:hypothetical protein